MDNFNVSQEAMGCIHADPHICVKCLAACKGVSNGRD